MRVVIVGGAGGVGASLAYSLISSSVTYEIVLVDVRPEMVVSHVMDLENAVALGRAPHTVRAGTLDDAVGADLVVISASVPLRLNISREVFLTENARIVGEVLTVLAASGFDNPVVLLTNPVDHLLTWAARQGWLPARKLVGYTVNDSLRLRTAVAAQLGLHPRDVDACVLGEHGAGQVPIFSRITVDGQPVELGDEQQTAVRKYIDTWYDRHVALDSGRTSTWSTGLGAARLIDAIATASGDVLPASVVLDGEYGIKGVALGVPVVLSPQGVDRVVRWPLSDAEAEALAVAAARVEVSIAALDESP
ncbi:MAG: malate dehydrogenase [Streptomyces sp.]|nr:malate dehydrogenase [Streptomyces sp.]